MNWQRRGARTALSASSGTLVRADMVVGAPGKASGKVSTSNFEYASGSEPRQPFGLRRQAKRDAALGSRSKAPSPLRSAGALQNLAELRTFHGKFCCTDWVRFHFAVVLFLVFPAPGET